MKNKNSLVIPVVSLILFSLLASGLFVNQVFATDYYVDPLFGINSNQGTQEKPWKTISQVNKSSFLPGDNIYFRRGRTWHETLRIPSSGEEGNPILFGSYGPGPAPVIDCSLPLRGRWVQVATNIYTFPWSSKPGVLFYKGRPKPSVMTISLDQATTRVPDNGSILFQIARDTPYTNLWVVASDPITKILTGISLFETKWDTVRNITVRRINPATHREEQWAPIPAPAGVSPRIEGLTQPGFWFWSGGKIYLYAEDHPDNLNVRAGKFDYGIHTNNQRHVIITDLTIKGANAVGVHVSGTENATIQNLFITGIGSLSYGAGLTLNNSSDNLVTNNRIENTMGQGIVVYAYNTVSHFNTISENRIAWTGAAGMLIGGERPYQVANNLISDNTVRFANQSAYDSGGIYVYFCDIGNVIRGNSIYNGGNDQLKSAGIMADTDSGPLLIEDNVIVNNSNGGILVTESNHIIRDNQLQNNARPQFNSAEIVFFPVNDNVSSCQVTGNTLRISPNRKFFQVFRGSTFGHLIDDNTYLGGWPKPFFWESRWLTFDEWQQTTQHDLHSTFQR